MPERGPPLCRPWSGRTPRSGRCRQLLGHRLPHRLRHQERVQQQDRFTGPRWMGSRVIMPATLS
ncbi:alpha/beta hydrolase domain protein [Mycobacterium xenopi 3993]|nr:alpha/beta hydrolase domain protein [Mycobacterium xenopi 3993]